MGTSKDVKFWRCKKCQSLMMEHELLIKGDKTYCDSCKYPISLEKDRDTYTDHP